MRACKIVLNLIFLGILILTGMELSNLLLSYMDKVFAEEDIRAEVRLENLKERDKRKEEPGRYLEGKRTLSRNILDLTPAEKKEVTQAKTEESKKEEIKTLNVKLLGVVLGVIEEAVVLEGSNLRRIRLGDEVMGYKVKRIERDLVILEKDSGEKALISLQYGVAQSSQEAKKTSQPPPLVTPPEPSKEERKEPQITTTAEGRVVISRDTVNEFLMSPQNFLRGIFIGPSFKDNKPNGFVVRNIANEHILAKIGIKKGDVIKKVNGIEINNVTDYYNAIRSVTEGDSLTLTIEREGKEIDIGCEIR